MAELVEVLSQIRGWMQAMFFVLLVMELLIIVANIGGKK